MRIRVSPAPWWNGVQVLIGGDDGQSVMAGPPTLKKLNECEEVEPTMRLSLKDAQVLMDDLWASGVRPSEKRSSEGALKATEYHLEDMRRLVFDRKEH